MKDILKTKKKLHLVLSLLLGLASIVLSTVSWTNFFAVYFFILPVAGSIFGFSAMNKNLAEGTPEKNAMRVMALNVIALIIMGLGFAVGRLIIIHTTPIFFMNSMS